MGKKGKRDAQKKQPTQNKNINNREQTRVANTLTEMFAKLGGAMGGGDAFIKGLEEGFMRGDDEDGFQNVKNVRKFPPKRDTPYLRKPGQPANPFKHLGMSHEQVRNKS